MIPVTSLQPQIMCFGQSLFISYLGIWEIAFCSPDQCCWADVTEFWLRPNKKSFSEILSARSRQVLSQKGRKILNSMVKEGEKISQLIIFCIMLTVLFNTGKQCNANTKQMMKTSICYKERVEIDTSLVFLIFLQGLCIHWPFVEMLTCSYFLKILWNKNALVYLG